MELTENLHEKKTKIKNAGLVTVGIFGGLATGIVAIAMPFVWPAFRKIVLPYVPATSTQIENVIQALRYHRPDLKKADRFRMIDLGSGDGRIVIECAKRLMIEAHGVELNPWLVLYSKYQAYKANVHPLVSFRRKNLFKVDLADYDKIVIFGVDSLMPLIETKTQSDCDKRKKEVTVIACRFPLPNWKPFASFGTGIDQVWLYRYYPSYVDKH